MSESKNEHDKTAAMVEVTVTSSDGTEHTTRVRLYDLGEIRPIPHPPASKTSKND
jgi:hypothetical protein